MWVFGYGSLMWDNWEASYGCLRRVLANLPGFHRIFNKASVKNWGTRERPAPTLNLTADSSSSCRGVAFEFPERKRGEVLAYLRRREGKGFALEEQKIQLESGNWVGAVVPIYSGTNLLSAKTYNELAKMACLAEGTNGAGVDYVQNLAGKLANLGIHDGEVDEFLTAIETYRSGYAVRDSRRTGAFR
jgi:cation transport protein ChaC